MAFLAAQGPWLRQERHSSLESPAGGQGQGTVGLSSSAGDSPESTETLPWALPGLAPVQCRCAAQQGGAGSLLHVGDSSCELLCITHIRNPSCQPAASRYLLTAERRAKPPRHCSCSQLSGQALFDWRKGKFLVLGIREQRPELPLHCPS